MGQSGAQAATNEQIVHLLQEVKRNSPTPSGARKIVADARGAPDGAPRTEV